MAIQVGIRRPSRATSGYEMAARAKPKKNSTSGPRARASTVTRTSQPATSTAARAIDPDVMLSRVTLCTCTTSSDRR